MNTIKSYTLHLEKDQFLTDYSTFRAATSQNFTYKDNNYPAVFMDSNQYAYLNIESKSNTLTLIINLEFYYVYGFKINNQYFAYEGEAIKALTQAGFTIPEANTIPYGDAYYQIGSYAQIDAVCQESVSLEALQNSISRIVDLTIKWTDKNEDLLRVFWCLVEGIRFQDISTIMNELISGNPYNTTFAYFYYMAERWAELSVGAAYSSKEDKSIAVYELHRLQPSS
ncbi:ribosome-inactivating family protein [Lacinutrix jangbogonensis]|uniref:ribosome-inactivating family protein n=1 Tax=Lacinutrix jangbogonensis TaxID=1469557 RepID=UPI000A5872BD|nr:ribosome-inactivating family protein [Lacinutrix jangbogonensis]